MKIFNLTQRTVCLNILIAKKIICCSGEVYCFEKGNICGFILIPESVKNKVVVFNFYNTDDLNKCYQVTVFAYDESFIDTSYAIFNSIELK